MRTRLGTLTRFTLLGLVCASLLPLPIGGPKRAESIAPMAQALKLYETLPMVFETNMGQTDSRVKYVSRGRGYALFLTPTEAVLVLRKSAGAALRMTLVEAASQPRVIGLDEMPGRANYFIGNDPGQWRTNIVQYARVKYEDVYPGVGLVYYGSQQQLEFDFVVAPGADPRAIRLAFEGAEEIRLDAAGDLVLHVASSRDGVRLRKPFIYQEIDGARKAIPGRYVLTGKDQVGFQVAAYDTGKALVIDPVLSYSTYLGGTGADTAHDIAIDAAGNVYAAGSTHSLDFPTTTGAFQTAKVGAAGNAFVTKLNATGSGLVYSTYLGGGFVQAIAVDAAGNAYVTGNTGQTNFATAGAFQTVFGGGLTDAYVTKLNAAGSALVYSTYLGGSGAENLLDIAVESSTAGCAGGCAYVAGTTGSTNFPTTPGAFQTVHRGGFDDAFVTKVNATGTALVYSTLLGGSGSDNGGGIAVDALGNAYVAGATKSNNFPTTSGAFQPKSRGSSDAFVTKLNAAGSALVYSTHLGGSTHDEGSGIAVDSVGNAYVTGTTYSTSFPTTRGAYDRSFNGAIDGFVTKVNATGSALVYSTHLGGSNTDQPSDIAVDAAGNAYVTGGTYSTNFPTTPGAIQTALSGINDAFVTKVNPTGSALVYSTYLGGSAADFGGGIVVDSTGNAYVAAATNSANFPTTAGAFQTVFGGVQDAFVAKIAP